MNKPNQEIETLAKETKQTLDKLVERCAELGGDLREALEAAGLSEVGGYTHVVRTSGNNITMHSLEDGEGCHYDFPGIDTSGYYAGNFDLPYRTPSAGDWLLFAEQLPDLFEELRAKLLARQDKARLAAHNLEGLSTK